MSKNFNTLKNNYCWYCSETKNLAILQISKHWTFGRLSRLKWWKKKAKINNKRAFLIVHSVTRLGMFQSYDAAGSPDWMNDIFVNEGVSPSVWLYLHFGSSNRNCDPIFLVLIMGFFVQLVWLFFFDKAL